MICHITTVNWWNNWNDQEYFESPELDEDGFIHCCTPQQLKLILNKYYKGLKDLVILHIDPELLEAELKYEQTFDYQMFPHVYGRLNKNSIKKIEYHQSETD